MTGRIIKMEYTIKVISLKPDERNYVEDGKRITERWVDVAFNIVDGEDKVVSERRIALAPNTDEKALNAELKKQLSTYKSDMEIAEKTGKVEEENKNIAELSKKFSGKEIK